MPLELDGRQSILSVAVLSKGYVYSIVKVLIEVYADDSISPANKGSRARCILAEFVYTSTRLVSDSLASMVDEDD